MRPAFKGLMLETSSTGDLQREPDLDSKKLVRRHERVLNPDIIRWERAHARQ
jgi:hypothetical protein